MRSILEEPRRLERLNRDLDRASRMLDRCARAVRDSSLNNKNVSRISRALGEIVQIQFEIYQMRPDLLPEGLKDTLGEGHD